jgi:hypothetical protein
MYTPLVHLHLLGFLPNASRISYQLCQLVPRGLQSLAGALHDVREILVVGAVPECRCVYSAGCDRKA